EPIDVVLLAGVRSGAARRRRRAHDVPLLGRSRELGLLAGRLRLARSGAGQVVGVAAEAGMGKSRLIHELLARPDAPAHPEGVCQSAAPRASSGVGRPTWRALLGAPAAADAARAALERLAASLLPRLPLLAPVLDVAIEDNDLTRPFDAKLRKTSLEALLV